MSTQYQQQQQQQQDIRHWGARDDDDDDDDYHIPASVLAAFWSAFTSELGPGIATLFETALPGSPPTQMPVTTTVIFTVPVTTLTIQSTLLETSFVTVPYTTSLVQPAFTLSSLTSTTPPATPTTLSSGSVSSSFASFDTPPASSTSSSSSAITSDSSPSLPLTGSVTLPLQTQQPQATSPPTAANADRSYADTHKHAIIGGLCGTIAALVVIGLLLCLWMLRRRRQQDLDQARSETATGSAGVSLNEKGLRPSVLRRWTEVADRGTSTPQSLATPSPATVDEEHHIIRMSVQHWPRPYANGQGIRESIGPAQLRVMNPDQHRPETSSVASDTAGSFLRKQRSALASLLSHHHRTRSKSSLPPSSRREEIVPPVPDIQIDPTLSQECIPNNANTQTPSFRSYPSTSSVHMVEQRPPEDPFLTPPDERPNPTLPSASAAASAVPRSRRPALTPWPNVSGSATRSLPRVGNAWTSLRQHQSTAQQHPPPSSHRAQENSTPRGGAAVERHADADAASASRVSSTRDRDRESTFSDPFDLDRPSLRTQGSVRGRVDGREGDGGGAGDGRTMYEGT